MDDNQIKLIILNAIIESDKNDGYGNSHSIVGSVEHAKILRENIFFALKDADLLKTGDVP